MEKILVTTDFSENSKAGMRFAIRLAKQYKFELTFFHVCNIILPTAWSNSKPDGYEQAEVEKMKDKLDAFVKKIYQGMKSKPGSINCVIERSPLPETKIMEYADANGFSFICMSTRGAGKLKRIWGTNTGNLITHSLVPVIAVPHEYKVKKITNLLYASDLLNLEKELKKVVSFARQVKASVELLHFTSPLETLIDSKVIEVAVKLFSNANIRLNIKNTDMVQTMVANIEKTVKKSKPSMLIMFTEQNRNLFQKIFLSSKAEEYAFQTTVPLLVFNKS
jgi:nucleotide-binding universal stress UspA family protein